MPTFEFTSPEGKSYEIEGPEGATQEQAFQMLQTHLGGTAPREPEYSATSAAGRGLAAGVLGARGDIESAVRVPFGLAAEHIPGLEKYSPALRKTILPTTSDLEKSLPGAGAGQQHPIAQEAGEVLSALPLGKPSAKAAATVARGIGGVVSKATGAVTGSTERIAQEGVRETALDEASQIAASHEADAVAYQKRLDAITKAQKQLSEQPATAEARAHAQALRHAPFAEEQDRVLSDISGRTSALEQEHRQAGASVEVARMLSQQAEQKIIDAEKAVATMEKDLLARPGASPEEFGGRIQQVAKYISDKYATIRESQSGYKQAIESAGNYQRVDTREMISQIDEELKGLRNPNLQASLEHVKELLLSDGRPALTLRSADSLRKYLDSIVQSKVVPSARGPIAVDKEAAHVIGSVKKQLVKAATDSWQPYKEALGKWRTLSRPLDIVERKGALRKVIDTDPVSTDYALTKAQVVGEVLRQSKAGNPVFTRLIQESPELRDSARLHFTQDLFGKEMVPTDASLRGWLKSNEGSLRQLGLYDEFKDIKTAKVTAQRAVEEAKHGRDMSKKELKNSIETENRISDQMKLQASLRDKEKLRIKQAQSGVTAPEDIMKESTARAKYAASRLKDEKSEAGSAVGRSQTIADRYRNFQSDIQVARPSEVARSARSFVDRMLSDKLIDANKHAILVKQIQAAEDTAKDAADLRRKMLYIGGGIAALGVGSGTVSHLKNVVGF